MISEPAERPRLREWIFESRHTDQTAALGRAIGRRLSRRATLLLFGDLGSGKTAFAQGLAAGLDVPADCRVTSPTYTLINEYPGRLPFYHADLYLLPEPVDPEALGLLDLFVEHGVTAVEWAQRLQPSDRPAARLEVYFSITGASGRSIRILAYGLDLGLSDLLMDTLD